MNVGKSVEAILKQETPNSVSKQSYTALLQVTLLSLRSARALEHRSDRPTIAMDMMVARPGAPQVASISLSNFFRQIDPTNPRFIKDALAAGGSASGLTLTGAGHLCAFLVAVMVLATRTVSRSEAMTLHLAWKVARADRTFTLQDITGRAHELRDDYEVDKVGETDVESYLNNLVRAGSLRSTPTGYKLVERIKIVGL